MSISVVIRARDEADAIGRTFDLLAAQDADHEVILVDDCSDDPTAEIAAARGARIVRLKPGEFTFGRALNKGCAIAEGDVIVALSAHAFPTSPAWLGRMAEAVRAEKIACACGWDRGPEGDPLARAFDQDTPVVEANPFYGYTNGAGGFRAELWRERGFDESLPGTEDREWAWYWLHQGWKCRIDPGLVVEHDHAHDSVRATYERELRELRGYRAFIDLGNWSISDVAGRWWSEETWHRSRTRARLDPRRVARLTAGYVARRK